MKMKTVHVAVMGALAAFASAAMPAVADTASELKAEIAAQRAQLEAQRLRLEALEKKLDAANAKPAPAALAANPSADAGFTRFGELGAPGAGYTFHLTPDDDVTLYGLLDLTVVNRNHADAAGDRSTNMEIGWFSGSRWGITGHHVLNNGGKAIFKLESEYEIPTGDMDTPGTIFNRDAWLGYQSSALGKLTLGRQNALPRDFSAIYGDPYTTARVTTDETGYTNSNNFKQLIFYAASPTGTRYDRGVVWKKDFGGLVAGAAYTFGGVPGHVSERSARAIALGYNGPNDAFHLAGYYTQFEVSSLLHKDWSFGGNVALGPLFRLYAGYYKDNTEQPVAFGDRRDHAWTVSTRITPGGAFDYELGYQTIHAQNAGVNGAGNVVNPYSDSSVIKGTATGDKKTLYGSVFYHFDRRTELYLVSDYAKLTDGYKVKSFNGFANQLEVGGGMRFRF